MLAVQVPTVNFYRPVFLIEIHSLELDENQCPIDWDEIEVNGCNSEKEAVNNVLRYLPTDYRIVSVSKI